MRQKTLQDSVDASRDLQDVLTRCRKTASWAGEEILRLNQKNDLGDTPLHTVCSWGELQAVQTLIASGADVNAKGDKGGSVLFNAVVGRSPEVVRVLLQNGADAALKNDWGITPLEYAIDVSAPVAVVDLLRNAGGKKK